MSDLSKFFIALLNGGEYQGARILDAEMTAEMLADVSGQTGVILLMDTSVSGADQRATIDILNALWVVCRVAARETALIHVSRDVSRHALR